jgi:excisionase family DNA binding protein
LSTKAKTKPDSHIDDPLFDMEEAARYLRMSKRWVKGQLAEGTIPRTKLGRLVRFRKSDLDNWIASNTTTPEGE